MAREEISFKLGLDAKAFQRGVTSVKSQLNGLATEKWSDFKKALSLGAAVEGVRRLGEAMLELRRRSEDIGASTDFLQAFDRLAVKFGGSSETANVALLKLTETIGQARTEGGGAAEKFEKLGISLYDANGNARNTEEIFKQIANAYQKSSDAGTKAALAFEFFGKSGREINNILGEGAAGIDAYTEKMKALGLIASADNVNAVADSWSNIKTNISGASTNLAGFALRAFNVLPKIAGALSAVVLNGASIKNALRIFRDGGGAGGAGNMNDDQAAARAEMAAKQHIAAQEMLVKLKEKQADHEFELLDDAKKIEQLDAEIVAHQRAASDLRNSELVRAEQAVKLEEKLHEWKKLTRKVDEDAAKDKARERKEEIDEHIAKMDRLNELIDARKKERMAMQEAKEARFKFSLQELAEADPRRFRGQTRQDILGAQEVQRLEKQAQWQNLFGTKEQRDKLQAMADQRRQQIGLLKTDEKFPFRDLEKSGSESAEALKTLLKYANEKGIPMKPLMGK